MRGWKTRLMLLAATLLLSACASNSGQANKLDELQRAYGAAIRWGDFEGAWNLVEPDYRKAHPMTDLQFERYKQIQISTYRDLGAQTLPDGKAIREIEIGVINRNNMTERSARYTERWRYDAEAKTWWLVGALPDLWEGE